MHQVEERLNAKCKMLYPVVFDLLEQETGSRPTCPRGTWRKRGVIKCAISVKGAIFPFAPRRPTGQRKGGKGSGGGVTNFKRRRSGKEEPIGDGDVQPA